MASASVPISRRKALAALAGASAVVAVAREGRAAGPSTASSRDVAVIGAGAFGAWTAWHLLRQRKRVLLLGAHGAANSPASSGGESRLTRTIYGVDGLYTRMAAESFAEQSLAIHRELGLPLEVLARQLPGWAASPRSRSSRSSRRACASTRTARTATS